MLVVVGCAIIYGVLVAANLFLILELAHPYVREIATSPQPLRDVVVVLSTPTT
ncbi:hypothetical protein [Mycobacterium sp. Aquia_213]|uniref:hypothetical protein n=1 Tax=Mycobacterium sp. Aquia_213 TaxID=2991728 RepID=UPI00226E53CA|nr:hypothetical protein [Mycobacterium sp. Aquia_213]WAC94602.1 hypothetical protein LMQ14_01320 [Mycobacterium sp. Aquia_213]